MKTIKKNNIRKSMRINVFETNSSSQHSVSIASVEKEYVLDTSFIPNEQDGNIYLNGDEFGWNFDYFNDALTKANYCAEYSKNKEYETEMLKEVIQEQTGANDVIIKCEGYIDHQSDDVASEAFSSKENLRNFIFNLNSWLFTGNDNSEHPFNFHDVPEYKGEKIIKNFYDYQLKVEGINTEDYKFKKYPNDLQLQEAISHLFSKLKYKESKGIYYEDCYSYDRLNLKKEPIFEYEYWLSSKANLIDVDKKEVYLVSDRLDNEAEKIYKEKFGEAENKNRWTDLEKIKADLLKDKQNNSLLVKIPFDFISLKNKRVKERIRENSSSKENK
jgi:hypothetical protein